MRAALRLVWALDVRHLLTHRARLALSAVGIAAGVALAVGVGALNSSIDASLRAVANAAASEANVEIRPNTEAGLPAESVSQVRGVPGVRVAGATIESYTRLRRDGRSERVLLLGIDQGVLDLAPEAVSPEDFTAADPFGLMLPAGVADALGAAPGEEVEVATPSGWKPVSVGGVLEPEAASRQRVAVGAIGVVQQLLDRTGRIDAIYVQASEEAAVVGHLQELLGPAASVGPIALRGDRIAQMLDATTSALNVASVVALFVGAFLVYNTMAMAAVERVREAAMLRAVGARRRQVLALFCAEGALLGAVGSIAGIAGGVLLAQALLSRRGGPLEDVFPIEITTLAFPPGLLAGAGIAGIVTALAAAFLPARRVARNDPAPALGPAGALEEPAARSRTVVNLVGIAAFVAGVALSVWALRRDQGFALTATGGFVLALAGAAMLIRTAVPLAARLVLRPVQDASARIPGSVRLASGEVLRSPGRTAFTAGAVLLALALVVGFGIDQASFRRTFELRFDEILRADLYVRSATWRPFGSDVPLAEELGAELRKIEGVEVVYPFRLSTGEIDGTAVVFATYDFEAYARLPGLSREGRAEARRNAMLLSGPGTILVSPSFTEELGPDVGDTVEVPTPTGEHGFRIAGILPDPGAITPEVFVDYETFREVWGTTGADNFSVGISPGVDRSEVKAAIERRFGSSHGVEVDTREQYQERLNSLVAGILALVTSVQLVALVVAGLGLANTLLISTLERRRDLGVLRAIGMLRRQVRRMVGAEALIIGGIGVVFAWGLGTVIGLGMFAFTQAQLGVPLDLVFPPWAYLGTAVLGVVAALVAAVYPAHRAATVDVVDALHYE